MELYTKNVTCCIRLDNFWFENFGCWKKGLFFLQIYFYLSKWNNKIIIVFTKQNTFLWFLDFLGEKLILDYVINTKSQILHAKFCFLQKFIFEHKSKFATKKEI